MADNKNPSAGVGQSVDLSKINPLIEKGDTAGHVQSVLGLLSSLLLDATDGSITLSYDDAHGLAMILDTCRAALAHGDIGEVSHD